MSSVQAQLVAIEGRSTAGLAKALGLNEGPSSAGQVDLSQVERIAAQVNAQERTEFEPARWDDDQFWNVDDRPVLRSQFFAIGNSINFRFWTLEDGRMLPAAGTLFGESYQGAMYMWRALRLALDATGGDLLKADFLQTLSDADFDRIFTDDTGHNPLAVARDDRIANLRDLGEKLSNRWDGRFFNLVESTNRSLVEFAQLSRHFRAFDDPMRKLTMLNAILHSGSRVYEFADEPLPAIDYHLLKQVLRQGLVRPNPWLARQLANSELLSTEDAAELRRLALVALVAIAERTGLSGEVLDNKLWLNRVNCIDPDPVCLDPALAHRCPFFGACLQFVEFERPLELTRYY
jgi:Potential Queuosine, Q, salvage protein family